METAALRARIDEHVRRHELIPAGGEVLCLVSGGADSTCLWHALRTLGYRVGALHVNHALRGAESDEDARFCREAFGAEVVDAPATTGSEAELRDLRYAVEAGRLRATGHTASDQVETILMRLASSGATSGIRVRRDDGVVRPLLTVWREETEAYCRAEGLAYRSDSSNHGHDARPHPAGDRPAAAAPASGRRAEHPREPRRSRRAFPPRSSARSPASSPRAPARSASTSARASWRCASTTRSGSSAPPSRWTGRCAGAAGCSSRSRPGLRVRGWRAGDRLAGRTKKVQDLFVDAKVPRSKREAWPLVVRGDEVVSVPGIASAPGWEDVVTARRDSA